MKDRFEMLGRVAEGGRGIVCHARDRLLGREVALKRPRPDAGGPSAATFLDEARQQSRLSHPNIVRVLDTGMDDEGAFIVLEWVEGETLGELVTRRALSADEFDSLARQALAGIGAAHEKGILHLDLNPENLMLQRVADVEFRVKILDFGLACPMASQPGARTLGTPDRLRGSVFYMAPEQFEDAAPDARTDLYALGCVFYHALTQKCPVEGETIPQVMTAHLRHRVTPLAALRPDLPARIVGCVEGLMQRLPASRPSSAAAALQTCQAAS
ncbi:MAG: serine/threonine protein kinase [Verrucomicrobiaceae bacterium]|nr:serine/threonine protein kinase [Verrucomicrobiaceae bacterium]